MCTMYFNIYVSNHQPGAKEVVTPAQRALPEKLRSLVASYEFSAGWMEFVGYSVSLGTTLCLF